MRAGAIRDGSQIFAQVDANLDSLPKIVRAGQREQSHARFAREVYTFILRRNWIYGARGGVPGSEVDTWFMARLLFMPELEARIGLCAALEVGLITVKRDGVTLPCNALRDNVTIVSPVTDADWVEIEGWDTIRSQLPRSSAERQRAYRSRKDAKETPADSDGVTESVTERYADASLPVTRYACNAIEYNRIDLDLVPPGRTPVPEVSGTAKLKAESIPDRAWMAADALRAMVLSCFPAANIGPKPWDGKKRPSDVDVKRCPDLGKTGNRLKWADALRLLIEQDGRSYDELWSTMKWLRNQPAGMGFIVQSPDALRKKWGSIQACMSSRSRPAARSTDDAVDAAVAKAEAMLAADGAA